MVILKCGKDSDVISLMLNEYMVQREYKIIVRNRKMISVHSQDGNIGTYNTATGDLQVKTEYDTHDRTVSVTLADASTTRSAYTIGSLDGVPMLETKVTDVPDRTMVRTLP